MENRGVIELNKGEYVFKKPAQHDCAKEVRLMHDKVFYGCRITRDKIICDDKTISGKVQVWF